MADTAIVRPMQPIAFHEVDASPVAKSVSLPPIQVWAAAPVGRRPTDERHVPAQQDRGQQPPPSPQLYAAHG